METNKAKKIFIIIAIGIISFILMLLSRISFAEDGTTNFTAYKGNPIEKIAETVVTHKDGSLKITEFTDAETAPYLAIAEGREFYCVNHGRAFLLYGEKISIETALKYGDKNGSYKIWPTTYGYCREFENNGKISYPYMYCTGNHHNLIDPNGEYHPDLAYIVTYPPMGEWNEVKQNAVWCTDFATDIGEDTPISEAGKELYQEALRYKEFFDKTAKAEGASTTETKINAKDKTKLEDVKTLVDYEAQTLTIGPLSIDYINGTYEGVAFGGISDMYFIGYNSNGEIVKDRV